MKAEDLLPFDAKTIPWETTVNDWALCLTTEPEGRVWVEHKLIRAVLQADHLNPEDVANIHGTLTYVGAKVAVVVSMPEYEIPEGKVRAIEFTWNPTVMRVGCFGGNIFVFLPRPEFEDCEFED